MDQQKQFNIKQQGQFKWPGSKSASRSKRIIFLRDPIWQFISVIVALLGVLIAFIGGILVPILFAHATPTPEPKSIMRIYTQNVSFNYDVCNKPLKHSIEIINVGEGTLKWTTDTPSAPWLTVSPTNNSVNPGKSDLLWLHVMPAGLSNGTYIATVNIMSLDGDFYTLFATLSVSLPLHSCQLALELT